MKRINNLLSFVLLFFILGDPVFSEGLLRGPYLQNGSETAITICWRTDVAVKGHVRFGLNPNDLQQISEELSDKEDHEIRLTDLQNNTRYYYSVGSKSTLAGGDLQHTFKTHPPLGSREHVQFWVLGDSGYTKDEDLAGPEKVRDAYLKRVAEGEPEANFWLMLGDNAYAHGTDDQYQIAVFERYPSMLRTKVLWPTIGNHDAYLENSSWVQGAKKGDLYTKGYAKIFSLPTNGESGGVASGTENYYSFDYANIHFICLDSDYPTSVEAGPDAGGEKVYQPNKKQLDWLKKDLQATQQEWLIAFWHQPPYSYGKHNSDDSSKEIGMRQEVLPILEQYGVDLVLGGHSHNYERSMLIDGHYGFSKSFDKTKHIVDETLGQVEDMGPYRKGPGLRSHSGTVYIVCGCSGNGLGQSSVHPVMATTTDTAWTIGSLSISVKGPRMDVNFYNMGGSGFEEKDGDHFSILKDDLDGNAMVILTHLRHGMLNLLE